MTEILVKEAKMKARLVTLLTLVLMMAFLLEACSEPATATVSTSNNLSAAEKLAAGTLKLEDSEQAISTSQAAELLTLWQGYRSLNKSDTASKIEMDVLVKQIQGVMTADQLKAVAAMNLTEQSVSDLVQSLGSNMQGKSNNGGQANTNSTPNVSFEGSTPPQGGPDNMPGGGGDSVLNAINGGATNGSPSATSQPTAGTQAAQVNAVLLNALIQMLETRSQSTG